MQESSFTKEDLGKTGRDQELSSIEEGDEGGIEDEGRRQGGRATQVHSSFVICRCGCGLWEKVR